MSILRATRRTVSICLAAFTLFAGCSPTSTPDPTAPTAIPTELASGAGPLTVSVEEGFAGRVLLARWYHFSYESPSGAFRTLADRPMAQVIPLTPDAKNFALPASVDSLFEFFAKANEYAHAEGASRMDAEDFALVARLASHRYALAPLTMASTDEVSRVTFSTLASWTPKDSAAISGSHVLLWVRIPLEAESDVFLKDWRLTGRFQAGWHLLRYVDSTRSLVPCPFSDTIHFRKAIKAPNLV